MEPVKRARRPLQDTGVVPMKQHGRLALSGDSENVRALTEALFDKLLTNLKRGEVGKVEVGKLEGTTTRLFFPNGIELISVVVRVGTTVQAEVKVAGEKGLKTAVESQAAAPTESAY